MPATTGWERHLRRREVIRLRYGQGMTVEEVAEELGWSEATINRDLERIRAEVAKMGDPDVIRERVLTALQHLLGHEYDDLHRADREGDERAKHRAKTSMRQTVEMFGNVHEEISVEAEGSEEALLDALPADAREEVMTVAEDEVEGILGS